MNLLTCLTLTLFIIGSAIAQIPLPDKVVANLYQQHAKQSPFFQVKNRALLDRYFTKREYGIRFKMLKAQQGQ